MLVLFMLGMVGRADPSYDAGYELGREIAKAQRAAKESEPVKDLEEMEKGVAVGNVVGKINAGDGVATGVVILLWLLGLVLGVLALFTPWMILRILDLQKKQAAMMKFEGKLLEAMNANLISISQQINHFGTGQPISRVSAPVPSARVEAPKTGLRR